MANPIKVKTRVEMIEPHGVGIYSVVLKPESRIPRFKAGQFLHLALDDYDPAGGFWPESRVFSIASPPGASFIEIVFSVKGEFTKRMERELHPGRNVWTKLPYGDFSVETLAGSERDVVLIAGGTGVSPFLPFLEALSESEERTRRIALHYGIRENGMLLHGELLEGAAKSGSGKIAIYVENEEPRLGLDRAVRRCRGRLDIEVIKEEANELVDPVFFLSGPPQMIALFKQKLLQHGVQQDRIMIDEWE